MAGTNLTTLTSTTFVDLGAAPVAVQTKAQAVLIALAGSTPDVGDPAFQLEPRAGIVTFQPSEADDHVYAIAIIGPTSVVSATVT